MDQQKRGYSASILKVEALARELSSSVQLSFAEPVAGAFIYEARSVMARTRRAYQLLAGRLTEQAKSIPGIEALLDNSHMIAGVLTTLTERWRRKETLRLPQVVDVDGRRLPRVYLIARSLVRESGAGIDRATVTAFLQAYQRNAPLSVRELDIFADMLQFVLVEDLALMMEAIQSAFSEIGDAERWLNRMLSVLDRGGAEEELVALMNQLFQERKVIAIYFGFHLLQRIAQTGRERSLRVISRRLRLALSRQGVGVGRLPEIIARTERSRAVVIDRDIASLHWLGQMRWDRISTELNAVDKVLARDPADIFSKLTDETRAVYRWTIVRIADRTGVHDVQVAREALRLAHAARSGPAAEQERATHVGYFLIGEGLPELERIFRYQATPLERLRRVILSRPAPIYLGVVLSVTVVLTAVSLMYAGFGPGYLVRIVLALSGALLASEIAVALAHLLFTRLLLPRPLPQIDCRRGAGPRRRTIVVVPSFVRDPAATRSLLSQLEATYVANQDPDIFFAALLDHADAPAETMPEDQARLAEVKAGIARLNARYPSEIPRFSVFCRKRLWNPGEGVFMGWERKRGKLREFNLLLRGRPTSFEGDAAEAAARYGKVRYVLTIDEDTELTRDSALALIGTIDHPLNRPVIDPERRVVTAGYGIVVPRSAIRFKAGAASLFSRIFGSHPGLEAYSTSVSDLYQDLFGDALFQGKGIYDIDAVETTMEGRIPDNTVLSHDLLEGLYARAGTAANAFIFEGFPSSYVSYMSRSHRWMRGDWQIISWAFTRRGSVFSAIDRWRIIDNLRRSLLPEALFVAVMSALFTTVSSVYWSILALSALGAGLILPVIVRAIELMAEPDRRFTLGYRVETSLFDLFSACAKTVLLGVFSLQGAFMAVDAIAKSAWRLLVSKRKLLQWRAFYEAEAGSSGGLVGSLRLMWPSVLAATLIVGANFAPGISIDRLSLTWAAAWALAPFASALVSRRSRQPAAIAVRDADYLRAVAAKTYWFFTDMVNEESHWLPPDHFQEEPVSKRRSHGLGVSPTNLGMYLVSISAARAIGLSTVTQFAGRLDRAFRSMSRMDRYRGHFFNWYELRDLTPLSPKYVSSVDSANLALALLAVRSALGEACGAPLFTRAALEGFDAKLSVLSEWSAAAIAASRSDSVRRRLLREVIGAVAQSRALIREALARELTAREADAVYSGAVHHAVRIRNTLETLRLEEGGEPFEDILLASRNIEALAVENRDLLDKFLGYATVTAVSAVTNDEVLRASYTRLFEVLARIPTVTDLADGGIRKMIEDIGFAEAVGRSPLPVAEKERALAWQDEILARLAGAEARSREIRDQLFAAAATARRFYDEMEFSFLYNEERGLFHMGYNASRDYFDDIFYDLFASEANSVSIVAISKRQAPKEHWAYLGRKLVHSSAHASTPVSWAGSLFEYLGTLIYFDISNESFWGIAAQRAVSAHRHFARRLGIPWGMGESASATMDASENYHYQAFGEPSLGFKRNLSDSVVVAPYTTALALQIAPRLAVANLRRLDRAGVSGRFGFYDAMDYTAYSTGQEAAGVPARIYYAHHQGFIMSSIANAVGGGWVHRMIAAQPEMKVVTQLFEEKMPDVPPVEPLRKSVRARPVVERQPSGIYEAPRRYVSVRAREADWHFISNGRYRVALSSSGAGDSRYDDVAVTRQSDDTAAEARGTFHYVFDRDRGSLWSPAFMPTRTVGEKSSVSFGEQVATYEKKQDGISASLAVSVDPRAPVEVRELTLTNHRAATARLTVGACAEVALARPFDELTHQNYEHLFVASDAAFDGRGLLFSRTDPRNGDRPVAAGFLVADQEGKPEELRLTRDRSEFYGPVIDRAAPPIMKDPGRSQAGLPRHTLDPAFGFVSSLTLRPGETRRIALVAAAGESREAVAEALRPYQKYHAVRRLLAGAGHEGSAALVRLGVTPSQADTFGRLASLLAARKDFAGHVPREDSPPLVDVLWRCGISGVRPILLLSVFRLSDLPLVRQMLACHLYFSFKKIEADIIIFNEHRGGYLKTLQDEIDFLLRVHGEAGQSRDCAVHCLRGEELDVREASSLHAAATVRIVAGQGSLSDQVRTLGRTRVARNAPAPAADPVGSGELDVVSANWQRTGPKRLEHWNGIGGYEPETGDYVITPEPGASPAAPWSNIVANKQFGFLATDRGAVFSWSRNSRDNKLTRAFSDPAVTDSGEAFYVRDDATGRHFSPLPAAGDARARYEIRHGQGYTRYLTHQGGLLITLTMHVAPSAPVKYCELSVKNDGGEGRSLTFYGYFELLLGSFPHETKKHLAFSLRDGSTLVVRNAYRNTFKESRVFLGVIGGADGFTVSKEEFIGRFGGIAAPAGLAARKLSSRLTPDGEPAAALSKKLTVAPGEERSAVFFIGEAGSASSLDYLIGNLCRPDSASETLAQTAGFWRSFPKLTFELPDLKLTLLCNRFLPYQNAASRLYGRAGFFQISGAYGFRDQLQDTLALLWHDPGFVRSHILTCAAHQFREGDALSWWHPHNDFGARTLLSDPHLWLPYAVAAYVEFTGESAFLDEEVPYLEGEVPDLERRSIVRSFSASAEKGSLYDHCVRAVEKGLTYGAHGLPLIGAADWNDGMNRVGSEGRGESVWLAWFTVVVLRAMAGLASGRGDADRAARYRAEADRYLEAIETAGWDGAWYRRAYTDAGVPVGTQAGKTWRIDSISQSWSVFALGRTPRTETALESAKREFRIWDGHVPLAWPPSDPELLDLGTLSDYPPGVRENAGQYNHAALWLARALFIVGDADAGLQVIDAVNPLRRSDNLEKALVYRGEPYAVAADVYSAPTYPGRAGWTWYTASAGSLYRTVVEHLLGIRIAGRNMSFAPALPSAWNEARVKYVHKTSVYDIRYAVDRTAAAPGVTVSFDGAPAAERTVPLLDDGKTHEVTVLVARPAARR